MEHAEIIDLWRSYDKKLEENLLFNRKNAEDITKLKVRSLLASMRPVKIFTVLAGILWVVFVDTLIINLFPIANPIFLGSAIVQVLLTKLAIGIYLYQLICTYQADISEPVLATQAKLSGLKSSTLWVARLLLLQLPAWTTFYWNDTMFAGGNISLQILQVVITAILTYTAIWLFLNIKYENREKKWFRLIFNGSEWDPIIKSMDLLSQVNEYRDETKETTAA